MKHTEETRRDFLRVAGVSAASFALGRSVLGAGQTRRRPNFIFILADDLGYGDLGCYGQKQIKTPSLDKMAAEGMRFADHYAGSTVCAPSRAALMTGLHTGHLKISTQGQRFGPDETTVAEILKQAGYATGVIGKWGLGQAGSPGIPARKGFDYFFGYLNQTHAHNYYPEFLWRNEAKVKLRNVVVRAKKKGRVRKHGGAATERVDYSHDLFTKEAIEFVERNKDRPFFLYLPYTIPHANNEAGILKRHGMEVPGYGIYKDKDWPEPQKGHAAMITRMDRDVGRLFAKLRELGLDERTLVMFSSDNGPHREGGARPDFFDRNGPFRGIKRDLYEGGIRVPMLARWPGKIKSGSVNGHPSAFWDFLPTCLDLAGLEAPTGINGISMAPTLLGQVESQKKHERLYWEYGPKQATRMGKWKAVRVNPNRPVEVYDLSSDVGEKRNVAKQHPDIVKRATAVLDEARARRIKKGGHAGPDRAPKPPMPDVYLADLEPVKEIVGHKPLGKAKKNRSIRGKVLSVAGTKYERGMGVHAPSELVYGLKPEYRSFVAVVGVDDLKPGSVLFQVFVGDRRVFQSPLLRRGDFRHINVSIPAGSKTIRLVVTDGGNGKSSDHADWVNAGFATDGD